MSPSIEIKKNLLTHPLIGKKIEKIEQTVHFTVKSFKFLIIFRHLSMKFYFLKKKIGGSKIIKEEIEYNMSEINSIKGNT